MSTTSVITSVCTSKVLNTKRVQVYSDAPFAIPKAEKLQKSSDMESTCLAIVNTMGNLYNVPTPEDYAHYVENVAPIMLSKVREHVAKNQPIRMVILASQLSQVENAPREGVFWRDDNLAWLDALCNQIATIYGPGAKVTVIMDGLIHNDLFGIGDVQEWEAIQSIQRATAERYSRTLEIVPMWNLLQDDHDDIPLSQGESRNYFLHHAQLLKDHLLSRFGTVDDHSGMIRPIFRVNQVSQHRARWSRDVDKYDEGKVALRIQVLANILDNAFHDRIHISL